MTPAPLLLLLGLAGGLSSAAAEDEQRPALARPAWPPGQVAYVISVDEARQSVDSRPATGFGESRLALRRTLHLSMEPGPGEHGGQVIRCTIRRIELRGDLDGQRVAYDSERAGQRHETDPVGAMLARLAGEHFTLRLAEDGFFQEVHGLDETWQRAGMGIPPAPLLGVQLLYRDQAMLRLLEEALSPPIPADVAEAVRYSARVPLEMPLVTPLEWAATFAVAGRHGVGREGTLRITGAGELAVARPIRDIGDAGLRTTVVEGLRESELHLDAATLQVVRHAIEQKALLSVSLVPPGGGEALSMTIRQRLTVSARRDR